MRSGDQCGCVVFSAPPKDHRCQLELHYFLQALEGNPQPSSFKPLADLSSLTCKTEAWVRLPCHLRVEATHSYPWTLQWQQQGPIDEVPVMSDSILWLESPWLFSTLLSEHGYTVLCDLDSGFGAFLIIGKIHLEQCPVNAGRSRVCNMGWVSWDHSVSPAKATCVDLYLCVRVCVVCV